MDRLGADREGAGGRPDRQCLPAPGQPEGQGVEVLGRPRQDQAREGRAEPLCERCGLRFPP